MNFMYPTASPSCDEQTLWIEAEFLFAELEKRRGSGATVSGRSYPRRECRNDRGRRSRPPDNASPLMAIHVQPVPQPPQDGYCNSSPAKKIILKARVRHLPLCRSR